MKKNNDIKIIPFDNVGFHGVKFIGKDGKEVSLSFETESMVYEITHSESNMSEATAQALKENNIKL